MERTTPIKNNIEIIFSNAVNYQINKQVALAEEGYLICIESEYKLIDCLNNLGLLYTDIQNFQKAEYVYLKMIEIQNENMEAYLNLGNIYSTIGSIDNGIKLYETALKTNPNFADIYNNLGILYKLQSRYEEALSTYVRGLLIVPNNEFLQHNLSNLIRGRTLAPEFMKLDSIEALLSRSLLCSNNESQDYIIAVLGYLFDKYTLNGRYFENKNGYMLLENPLFQLALRKTIITNFYLENFLIKVRKEILNETVNKKGINKKLHHLEKFIYSFAIQCFWSEYIYIIESEENNLLNKLDLLIVDAIKRKDKNALFYIALYGCYSPLYSKTFINNRFILQQNEKNNSFKELYQVQVQEPLEEKRLKKDIVVLNPLKDEVSQKVGHQYEENPYPRWISVKKVKPKSFEETIKAQLPLVEELEYHYKIEDKIDILIAGSGTGKHPIEVLQHISNANVIGIDLSRASIAYAQRKTTELRLANLQFVQGNILDLKLMNKKFDLIESVGVLHHMEDPTVGWKILTDILKPNAYIKIGLYSEFARKSVVDTISFIEERGYKAELADIRRCRNDIYHLDPSHSMWRLASYADFYSVSGTRDLIFNIQEHRFTIPQIAAYIQTLGLKFLGFSFRNKDVYQRYLEMFPEDSEGRNLKNWHTFEVRYPDTFIEMYQFWLQKS